MSDEEDALAERDRLFDEQLRLFDVQKFQRDVRFGKLYIATCKRLGRPCAQEVVDKLEAALRKLSPDEVPPDPTEAEIDEDVAQSALDEAAVEEYLKTELAQAREYCAKFESATWTDEMKVWCYREELWRHGNGFPAPPPGPYKYEWFSDPSFSGGGRSRHDRREMGHSGSTTTWSFEHGLLMTAAGGGWLWGHPCARP